MALMNVLADLGSPSAVFVWRWPTSTMACANRTKPAFVEARARTLGLPFYAGTVDVPALAKSSGDSIEEAARRARYAFFDEVAEQTDANKIATGHTKDDQAETVLMRTLRGTGVRGLAGIPGSPRPHHSAVVVCRPCGNGELLPVSRHRVRRRSDQQRSAFSAQPPSGTN